MNLRMLLTASSLFVAMSVAQAQERISQDEAQKYAKLLAEKAKDLEKAPFKTPALDTDKAGGVHHEEYGAMTIPASGLSAESLEKSGDAVVPLGHLWLRKLAPHQNGSTVDDGKLRHTTLNHDGQEYNLCLLLLGLKKKDDKSWELLVYGNGTEPLMKVPVTALTGTAENSSLYLDGKDNGDNTGALIFQILGKHQATFNVAAKE